MIYTRVVWNPLEPSKAEIGKRPWSPSSTPLTLLPAGFGNGPRPECTVDGKPVEGPGWDAVVRDGAWVCYRGSFGATGIATAGVALHASGGAAAASSGLFTLAGLKGLAGLFALSFAVSKLLGASRKPAESPESEGTYGWQGLQSNSDANGAAIPVIYGTHPVAGPVIGQYTISLAQPPVTYLYMLFLLGEGPITAVGEVTVDSGPYTNEDDAGLQISTLGIEINGQPAENFYDVEAYVRLGGLNQTAIPGFTDTKLEYGIEQALDPSEDPGPGIYPAGVELASGTYGQADPEIAAWDTAVTFTATETADEFTYRLLFPQGLYAFTGSGNLALNTARFQVRYVELSGGSPTGDYVVLPPDPDTVLAVQAPVAIEWTHKFIDPADYAPPAPGHYLVLDGATNGAVVTAPGYIEQAQDETELGISMWVRFKSSPPVGNEHDHILVHGSTDTNSGAVGGSITGTKGFHVWLHNTTSGAFAGLRFGWGNGAGSWYLQCGGAGAGSPALTIRDGSWHHLAFRYIAYKNQGGVFYAVAFLDGQIVGNQQFFANNPHQPMLWNDTADLLIGRLTTSSPAAECADIDVQELAVMNRALSDPDVLALYNQGKGFAMFAGYQGLVGGWAFDLDAGGYSVDISANGNDCTLGTGSSISTGANTGQVLALQTGTPKNSTYQVEIQRIDAEDTTGFAQDSATWASVVLTTYQTFTYPGSALLALKVKATDQLSGSRPLVTALCKGRAVPIWDGASAQYPAHSLQWSNNPARVATDMLTNDIYGMGARYTLADLYLDEFEDWATWCDELTKDGHGSVPLVDLSHLGTAVQIKVSQDTPAPPVEWVVGTWLIIENCSDAEYDTERTDTVTGAGWVAYLITSTFEDNTAGTRTYVCQWPIAQTIPTVTEPVTPTGDVFGAERRMEYDGVRAEQDSRFWDELLLQMQTGRAAPVRRGSRVGAFYDRARSPVGQVGMGVMAANSFATTYSDISNRPNAITVEHLQKPSGYKRLPTYGEHPDINDPASGDSFRRRSYRREGVVRPSQVSREIKYELNVHKLLTRLVSFRAGIEAVHYEAGDVLNVSHDVPQWGFSGRVMISASYVPSVTLVRLDREVTIAAATTYEVEVVRALDGTRETRVVSNATGTYAAGEPILVTVDFTVAPVHGDPYSFGETAASTKAFSITSTDLAPDSITRNVQAIEYDEQVYDDDFGVLPASPSALPVPSTTALPSNVELLTVGENVTEGPDGSHTTGAALSWKFPSNTVTNVHGVAIWLGDGEGNGGRQVDSVHGTPTSYTLTDNGLASGSTYTIWVQTFNVTGVRQPIAWVPSVKFTPRGLARTPAAPTALTADLAGEVAVYAWAHARARCVSFELRRGGWIMGDRVALLPAGALQHETGNWATGSVNTEGQLAPTLYLRALKGTGQASAAATLAWSPSLSRMASGGSFQGVAEEDAWGGTLTDLVVDTAYTPNALKFTGASLTGTYDFTVTPLAEAEWVWPQIIVEAYQVHPQTWGEMDFAWDGVDAERWTWEGPLLPVGSEAGNGSMTILVRSSTRATASGSSWEHYRPGQTRMRSMDVRVQIVRPSTAADVRVRRVSWNMAVVPGHRRDHIRENLFA